MTKILMVDDNEELTEYTSHLLVCRGHSVRSVSDPRAALAAFLEFEPDVSLLDYHMPHMLGSAVCDIFRQHDPQAEIIFLTAADEASIAVNSMKRGASDYLVKPIDSERLEAAITRALDHRKLVQENIAYRQGLELMVAEKTSALNATLKRMEHLNSATLETLGLALDFRDQSTSGHSKRVAARTTEIARMVGISGAELLQIEQGAFLHDIGKLKIPDSILLKPDKLSSVEWAAMRRHPDYGREFLQQMDFLAEAAQIVYSHHEKFDGSGYPRGLKGEQIPIGARIFAIVDSIDAMTSKRPYNSPVSIERALAEIEACSGKHFDPDLIKFAVASALVATG